MSTWLLSHPWSVGWVGLIFYAETLWAVYH